MRVPFSRVCCTGNELRYVKEVLESGWLTTAGRAAELERRFAEAVGSPFACAVNSCTAALHLALEASGVRPGDRVFVPAMTFTATAEVIRYLGAHPVFLDVEYGSCLLSPGILEQAVRDHPGVKFLIVVHYGGQPAELVRPDKKDILTLCRTHGITLIEDAAHAFPTRINDRWIGSIGDVTCFSFYANKTITTGEGGMLTTGNKEIAERVRIMRLHGINRDVWDRFTSGRSGWEYDIVAPGYKYNMPDINAAIGLAQLEKAEAFRSGRERCARYYFERLSPIAAVDLPALHCRFEEHAWHLFHIVLNDRSPVGRSEFIARMAEKGIGTSVHYKPLYRMSYYRDAYAPDPDDYPGTEKIWKGCVSLPVFPSMTDDQLSYTCETIIELLTP